MTENILEIKNLRHSFNADIEVLKGINLNVSRGEIAVSYTHLTLPTNREV